MITIDDNEEMYVVGDLPVLSLENRTRGTLWKEWIPVFGLLSHLKKMDDTYRHTPSDKVLASYQALFFYAPLVYFMLK